MNKFIFRLFPFLIFFILFLCTCIAQNDVRSKHIWGLKVLENDDAWFASNDARTIANSVIQYQSSQGGWPKSTNLAKPPLNEEEIPPEGGGRANSLDNNATTLPMEFLARMVQATNEKKYKTSFYRGLDYLFDAQYPNGGWPQFWPLRGDKYFSRITYNDDAMIRVMTLLKGVASGKAPYIFVSKAYQNKAKAAVELGIDCILKTQICEAGALKVWCAQHDEKTLAPAWARAYEPPSLSGSESVEILRFLMSIENPSPKIVAAIEGGVSWFKSVAITDYRLDEKLNPDGRTERFLVPQLNAPLLWARFYELGTNRPLYVDRDSKFRYNYDEISYERRTGYRYLGYWAKELIEYEYPSWKRKNLTANPHRILVSTDIGGTDPDDFQSMIHLLMYANEFQIEGLVSSPYGKGRKQDLLDMIDLYEKDFPKLKAHSTDFPSSQALQAVCKQGATQLAPYKGFRKATEGSEWIVRCAKKQDNRPLWVLVWGGLEDVAQALHDAPSIKENIKVYWIGGPNKKWSANAYAYIAANHPDLWMIEANATYRGWFMDAESPKNITNDAFYDNYIQGKGAMGKAFKNYYDGILKMGDTPSLTYLMNGDPANPLTESWGGNFSPINHSSSVIFNRNTTTADTVVAYATLEWRFKGPALTIPQDSVCFTLEIWNQVWPGYYLGDGIYGVRYASKKPEIGTYTTSSAIPELDGQTGQYVSITPWPAKRAKDDFLLGANWYSDRPEKEFFMEQQQGVKTVSKYRKAFLMDWANRWEWLHSQEIPLYEGEIPNNKTGPNTEEIEYRKKGGRAFHHVNIPTLTVFKPKFPNGKAVIICPGGGYARLAFDKEGVLVAQALNKDSITAFVLKYRIPQDKTNIDKSIAPLQDAQQAIRYVRKNAAFFRVKPNQVGIMGFSAGGHLAASAATHFSTLADIAESDTTSVRPDFSILIYPVISFTDELTHKGSRRKLIGENPTVAAIKHWSLEQKVTATTPPTFLVHAGNDKAVPVGNSLAFYQACLEKNIPVEMHLYPKGGHGFGMNNPTTKDKWMKRLVNWIQGI